MPWSRFRYLVKLSQVNPWHDLMAQLCSYSISLIYNR